MRVALDDGATIDLDPSSPGVVTLEVDDCSDRATVFLNRDDAERLIDALEDAFGIVRP